MDADHPEHLPAATLPRLPHLPAAAGPRVRVHLVDTPRDLDPALLEALAAAIVRAAWAKQGGPDADVTLFFTDRAMPPGDEPRLLGLYLRRPRQIRIHLGVIREAVGAAGMVRLLARIIAHEATHACIHARQLARGEARPGEVPRLPVAWDYLTDAEEMRARWEETALDGALYPGIGLLPRADRFTRMWVPPSEMKRYREILPHGMSTLLARLERAGRRLPPPRWGLRPAGALLRPVRPLPVDAAPRPAAPPGGAGTWSLRRFRELAREMYPGVPAPVLDFGERRALSRTMATRRRQWIGQFASARGMGTDRALGEVDFAAWRDSVSEALDGDLRALVRSLVALYDASPAAATRGRASLVARLDALVQREAETRRRCPHSTLVRDEAVAFFDARLAESLAADALEARSRPRRRGESRGRAAAALGRFREEGEAFGRLVGAGVAEAARGAHRLHLRGSGLLDPLRLARSLAGRLRAQPRPSAAAPTPAHSG